MGRIVLPLFLAGMAFATDLCAVANRTPVTIRLENTSLHSLLRTLFAIGGCSYLIDSDVPDFYIRSVSIVDTPLEVALRGLSRSWRLTCNFEGELCTVAKFSPRSGSEIPQTLRTSRRNAYCVAVGWPDAIEGDSCGRISLGSSSVRMGANLNLIDVAAKVSQMVTPEVLDDLAVRLRRQIDVRPDLQQRLSQEQIGLMQFRMINVDSPTLVTNIAEDLSTSLIQLGFNLVERAQLDKACEELRLQDTALIDPADASQIGRLTGCGIIVVGSISDRGGWIVINARLVETATGKALAADRIIVGK
ncbi:MAG: CsgG/HfaB family protein [Armatimonadetes bacterium]|nr:CsgG/HfaB family protein [Armatimonadota bacterium]